MSVRKSVKAEPKMYRFYAVGDDGITIYEGTNPPTMTYDRNVFDGYTEDENISFTDGVDCEYVDDMDESDFEDKFNVVADVGSVWRGPISESALEMVDEDEINEERNLVDCED